MTATTERSGLGHQLKADEKALNGSRDHLQKAYDGLIMAANPDAVKLRNDILKLMVRCTDLSYSANEAYRIND